MREQLAAKLIRRMYAHPSEAFRQIELKVLTRLTAKAFGASMPPEMGACADPLEKYALFTKQCMEHGEADEERLYRLAYRLGRRIRRITGLKKPKDLQRLVVLLYRNIGIYMSGRINDEIRMNSCYFSRHYSPEQCRIISALDSGVIAGIWGGGRLEFEERITEGCPCCRAHLRKDG